MQNTTLVNAYGYGGRSLTNRRSKKLLNLQILSFLLFTLLVIES